MKTLTTLFILSLSTSISFAQITNNWTKLNSGTTENINDIYFQSPDTGYIVGDNYLFKKTTDGGQSWVNLTPPNIGERPGNNGNIIAIDHHSPSLILIWEQPYYPVVTSDEGNSYSSLYSVDSAFCSASGFSVLNASGGYTRLVMYGMDCTGGGIFSNYLDGPFSVHNLDSSYNSVPGAFTDVDSGDSLTLMMGHDDGNLFSYENLSASGKDTILLDTTGVDALAYAGNQTWYASTSRNTTYHMYKSIDNGLSFQVDSTFIPTFFYPKFRDMDFLDNGIGICGGQSSGANGFLVIKNNQGWGLYQTDHPINAVKLFPNETAFAVGDSGLVMKTTNSSIGMEETQNKAFVKLYPNPVNSTLHIELEGNRKIESIELYDSNGRLVHHFPGNTKSIDFSTYSKGLYLIKLSSKDQQFSKKIVVE